MNRDPERSHGTGGFGHAQQDFSTKIAFSGYEWAIKHTDGLAGPGPNPFAKENVSVDRSGRLHLLIDNKEGHWRCAEVVCEKSLGYGTYAFTVATPPDIDPQMTLGLFTWSDDWAYHHREVDIEVGRWGDPKDQNCQMVVQPFDTVGNILRFDVPTAAREYVCSFTWLPTEVRFAVKVAHGKVVKRWTYRGADVPKPGDERTRINLWLIEGKPPQEGKPVEVVIRSFKFSK